MIEWGQKLKPKKVPGPKSPKISNAEFPSLDQFGCTFFAELRGRDTRALTRIFSYFKYPLKSRTWIKLPKNVLAKFSYPKKIPELKVSNPNKSFDHHRHLKSGVRLLSARHTRTRESLCINRLRSYLSMPCTSLRYSFEIRLKSRTLGTARSAKSYVASVLSRENKND